MGVFIDIANSNGKTKILEARNYQREAYNTFMSNKYIEIAYFNYPGNIKFHLKKFEGNDKFCYFVKEDNEHHILSNDKDSLSGYIAFRNIVTNVMGGYKRKSITKRKSTTKRKSATKKKICNKKKIN